MKQFTSILKSGLASCVATLLCVGAAQAQPTVNSVSPHGAYLMEPAAALTFTANSTVGINTTDISVQLTTTTLAGDVLVKNYTSANGLTVGGTANSRSVSLPLKTNRLYAATISVKDVNNATASSSVNFTTLAGYTFEAEDYDYTAASVTGQFFNPPQTNAYSGLAGTYGTDFQHDPGSGPGANVYRPRPGGVALEGCGDTQRIQYSSGQTDYDIGWNNGGDWENYTRTYPAGTYNVYLRGADGNAPEADAATLSVVSGTATLTGNGSFKFAVPGGGWQNYHWCPLKDASGNLVTLTSDGSTSTLQAHVDNGNFNANFYMLVPVETNSTAVSLSISNVYPNGQGLYQQASTLSFTINSATAIDASGISVQLIGTNLWGQGAANFLSVGSGLSVSGPSTSLTFSANLNTNTIYKAVIIATDSNGGAATTNVVFDTISPTYTFEAEDYDYNSGQFIDNPQTNAYANLNGIEGVDTHVGNSLSGAWSYRNQAYLSGGLETEPCGDFQRAQYAASGLTDYNIGFNDGGNWGNYTRTLPAGTYNVYMRAANGNGGQSDSASLSLVTAGLGTANQTVLKLGTFGVPNTGGWQTYSWVPCKDVQGNLVQLTGGSVKTLRITTDGGNYNANFYLLVPANPSVHPAPYADNIQPDGSHMFQPTNVMTFLTHSVPGLQTTNITLALNGSVVSTANLSFSGSANLWTVTCPVKTNVFYTAVITLKDANGTWSGTNTFYTYSPDNFQWEAEDYDYNSGLFHDNPQINGYANAASVAGVDCLENDVNAFSRGYTYRPMAAQGFPDSTAGDEARSQFVNASGTDYSIGSFGGGSFANFTRTYPAGSYYVVGRFAEGAGVTEATIGKVTSGFGTSSQTVQTYGTFFINSLGWGTWQWAPLLDNSGNLAKITLDGTQTTLQLGGSPVGGQPEVNVNFFMLVPAPPDVWITPTVGGGQIHLTFPTVSTYSYQVQYKNNLKDPTWSNLGSPIPGDGSAHTVNDSTSVTNRFYRVQFQ